MESEIIATSWAEKTYENILETAASDGSVAIVPVGSVEQHGHHLPVATDTILAEAIAQLGAERVMDKDVPVMVTPPIWTGNSPHHVPFGGTISIGVRGLLDVLERVGDSILENDFDALLYLNGHGGNISTVKDATSVVGDAHPDAEILGLTYFQLAEDFIHEIRDSDIGGMAHAGEFETSLMLQLRRDLVNTEAMEGSHLEESYDRGMKDLVEGGPLSVYRTFEEYSESGAIGDPHLASAEKGGRIYELLGDEMEDLLLEIHEQNS